MQPVINWDTVQLIRSPTTGLWYIYGDDYFGKRFRLHKDGNWRETSFDKDGCATGYYQQGHQAESIMEKYRPCLKLSQLKYGDKFRFKDGSFGGKVFMKIRTGSFTYSALCMTKYETIDIAFDHDVILEKS